MIFDKWGVHHSVNYPTEFKVSLTTDIGKAVDIRTTGKNKQHVKERIKVAFPKAKHIKIEEVSYD